MQNICMESLLNVDYTKNHTNVTLNITRGAISPFHLKHFACSKNHKNNRGTKIIMYSFRLLDSSVSRHSQYSAVSNSYSYSSSLMMSFLHITVSNRLGPPQRWAHDTTDTCHHFGLIHWHISNKCTCAHICTEGNLSDYHSRYSRCPS